MTDLPQLPTLEDVSNAAGVSTATVSRVLNGAGNVSDKAREKVMKAVDALGYTPNFGARAMAAKRTATIGAIIPTMDNAIFARGLQAFQERLTALGYTLLVASNAYSPALEAEQIKALVARGAEGLLLIGYARNPEIYDFLDRRRIPYVVTWAHQTDQSPPAVGFNNRNAMRALADQVLDMGHRKVAVISAPIDGNDRAAERVAGIRDAMVGLGLDPDMPLIETPYGIDTGAAAFEALVTEHEPTVVMCVNDVLAAGALMRARTIGLRVPQDISVTGFDDIEIARITDPPLTTVHVPHRQMGRRAADELAGMIEGPLRNVQQTLETKVIQRGSLRQL